MKKKIPVIIFIVALLIGLSLLLYPTISEYWNQKHQTRSITNYTKEVSDLDKTAYKKLWSEAQKYNKGILKRTNPVLQSSEEAITYYKILNVQGTGIMGYIEIPSIDCTVAIYHGTSDTALQLGIGHVEWSSLPVGGESTHCVLSGHRGLPSALLFTNLDRLTVGDTFMLHVLDETLTYEVDQILTVDPGDVSDLMIEEGKDLCTLVTCTPYGVNTHRLLVRGHRIDTNEVRNITIAADAIQINEIIVAVVIGIPLLIIVIICLVKLDKRKKKISR